jgi:class 3 adenylate cyclase
VLFTDIVGSTQTAGQLGDRRWRDLLGEHHARILRLLERFADRGEHTLKGIPGQWQLFAVTET